MNITKLQLLTNDIEATTAFYKDILDIRVTDKTATELTLQAGSTQLIFLRSAVAQPVYHFAFTVPSNKLRAAFHYLSRKVSIMSLSDGGKIADFSHWNAEAFYFYDNNGNILEYIARHDLDNAEEEAFSGSSLCCISEIGLVTDNVPALAGRLSDAHAIPFFAKQARQDQFTVLGDDHGLLILVAEERPWYPTTVKAESFPLLLGFTENGSDQELQYGG